jgi:hypothetical protein
MDEYGAKGAERNSWRNAKLPMGGHYAEQFGSRVKTQIHLFVFEIVL